MATVEATGWAGVSVSGVGVHCIQGRIGRVPEKKFLLNTVTCRHVIQMLGDKYLCHQHDGGGEGLGSDGNFAVAHDVNSSREDAA